MATTTTIFLTTTSLDEFGSKPAPMGSFVYAMPDVSARYLIC
jgi:hypothetical protein